ncbi:MAG: Crp/Fnr family transcriptional regulator [Microvirga sp.]
MTLPLSQQGEHLPLLRKLESIADLSDEEKQAILNLPVNVRVIEADTDIVRDGDRPAECCLILDGFTCRYKLLPDGTRQITGFYIPGDIPDLQSLFLHTLDNSLGTFVKTRVAMIPHQILRDLFRRNPRIAEIFWRDSLIEAAIFREWMVGLGRRSAYQRMAHLLCELQMRLRAVGLAQESGYDLPLTQNEIGDALGLSTVHVNRVLQDLRNDGLVVLRAGALTILDWEGLKSAAEFDLTYLHLDSDPEDRQV